MYPILYASITPGVVPTDLGLGTLSDCLSCEVQEARNGVYELEMTYPESGIHAKELEVRGVIKAKPNFTDDPQLFRIYKIGKVMRGKFTIYARHISYDLSGSIIESGTASTCVTACELLENAANGFTIETDKNVTANFTITEPSSVRSWFAGKTGSLLDVYGTGEYKYDNFDVRLLLHRGQNRGVTLRYGKNLTELKQELNGENLVTGVIAFYKDADGVITKAPKVSTGLILDTEKDYAYDCSSLFDETPTVDQLTAKANEYIDNHILTHLVDNITLNFVQIAKMPERVDLCDTVNIYLEALGIETTVQCIKTTWDVLKGRYSKTEFGEPKSNISDTILSIQTTANEAVSPSIMSEAISNATSKITGNQGGYVVWHDANADQKPDEILVVDNLDLSQAVKVWRWNTGGLGYSNTGYNGNYVLALTNDGKIVADRITTGTMSANRVRTGILSDELGKNTINLDTGEATFTSLKVKINNTDYDIGTDGIRTAFAADDTSVTVNSGIVTFNSDTFVVNSTNLTITSDGLVTATRFKAKRSLQLIDTDNIVRASMAYSTAEYSGIWLYDNTSTYILATAQGTTNGGLFAAGKPDGTTTASLGNQAYGGYLTLRYSSSAPLAVLADNGTNGSGFTLYRRNNILNARIVTDTYGGLAKVYNTSGDGRVSIGVGDTDNGFLSLFSPSGTIATLWNSGNGGTLHLSNPSGNIRVGASINSSDDGYLTLNDNQTHPSVELFRSPNGFGSAYFHAGYDYTKLAVSITESVDGGGLVAVYGPSMSGTAVSMFYSGTNAGSLYLRAFDGTAKIYEHGESGVITCVQCTQTSSRELKKNIFDISEGEAYKVLDLRPVSFDYKDGTSDNRRGFIAEEVKEYFPNLVSENPETHLPNLNYTEIIPYLVKVCQMQEKRIKALEAQHG
jgi:phage minor structural protein